MCLCACVKSLRIYLTTIAQQRTGAPSHVAAGRRRLHTPGGVAAAELVWWSVAEVEARRTPRLSSEGRRRARLPLCRRLARRRVAPPAVEACAAFWGTGRTARTTCGGRRSASACTTSMPPTAARSARRPRSASRKPRRAMATGGGGVARARGDRRDGLDPPGHHCFPSSSPAASPPPPRTGATTTAGLATCCGRAAHGLREPLPPSAAYYADVPWGTRRARSAGAAPPPAAGTRRACQPRHPRRGAGAREPPRGVAAAARVGGGRRRVRGQPEPVRRERQRDGAAVRRGRRRAARAPRARPVRRGGRGGAHARTSASSRPRCARGGRRRGGLPARGAAGADGPRSSRRSRSSCRSWRAREQRVDAAHELRRHGAAVVYETYADIGTRPWVHFIPTALDFDAERHARWCFAHDRQRRRSPPAARPDARPRRPRRGRHGRAAAGTGQARRRAARGRPSAAGVQLSATPTRSSSPTSSPTRAAAERLRAAAAAAAAAAFSSRGVFPSPGNSSTGGTRGAGSYPPWGAGIRHVGGTTRRRQCSPVKSAPTLSLLWSTWSWTTEADRTCGVAESVNEGQSLDTIERIDRQSGVFSLWTLSTL